MTRNTQRKILLGIFAFAALVVLFLKTSGPKVVRLHFELVEWEQGSSNTVAKILIRNSGPKIRLVTDTGGVPLCTVHGGTEHFDFLKITVSPLKKSPLAAGDEFVIEVETPAPGNNLTLQFLAYESAYAASISKIKQSKAASLLPLQIHNVLFGNYSGVVVVQSQEIRPPEEWANRLPP